jgi:hypothetical protein
LSLGDFRPGIGSDFCCTPTFLLTCDRSQFPSCEVLK